MAGHCPKQPPILPFSALLLCQDYTQPQKPGAALPAEGANILMCSVPPSCTSPPPPECHRQSFSKTWSPCNFQFVRNIKIEDHSLQAAHIESDATFCVMSDHGKRNGWLPWAALNGFLSGE